jgi:hypothetical protein
MIKDSTDYSGLSSEELMARAAAVAKLADVLSEISAVSDLISEGKYHEAWKAAGVAENILYSIANDCFELDRKHNP